MPSDKKQHLSPVPFRHIIAARRQALELTQAQVADAIGITSAEFIGLLEKDLRRIDLNKVPRLADALSLSPSDLTKIALSEQFPLAYEAVFGAEIPDDAKPQSNRSSGDAGTLNMLRSLDTGARKSILQLIESLYVSKMALERVAINPSRKG